MSDSDDTNVDLKAALEERYLAYALSTIMHRALPDVRDGMKPVHRRLLFAMRQLRLDPGQAFKKSARVVGDVIGKYHPHGDTAVYDALVRLAQDFAVRYPLVDGQGNFGTVDGDSAAAMRYTEARMTDVARLLLDGLDEDAVDFRDTYDGSEREPVVLPGGFPNLLANGASGIAVGMATNVPPHNAAEIAEAALHLIKHPNARLETIFDPDNGPIRGPDFPTGGVIVESASSMAEAYRTGRGGFRTRARWEIEDLGRGTWQIVVTEIPYQVTKSRLIERIAELLDQKKLPLLADVRDESAEDIRVVLEPRSKTVDAALLMESLFRVTDLETRIPLNMNVLMGGQVPRVVGLIEVIRAWLDHLKEVAVRRAQHRLEKVVHRLEVLDGFLVVYLDLDRVIQIIRYEDDPKAELMKVFELTEVQAEAILNMRLRSLRRLEEMEIRKEHERLTAERAELEALLGSEDKQWQKVASSVREVRKLFGLDTKLGHRRTSFADAPSTISADIVAEAMIEREPITVVLSQKGWIRALRGHTDDFEKLAFRQDDQMGHWFHAQTTDKLLILTTDGRVYTLGADKLPGGRGHGEPLRLILELSGGVEISAMFVYEAGSQWLIASQMGRGFIVGADDLIGTTKRGRAVMSPADSDVAMLIVRADGDHVAVIGENRKLVVFPIEQVPTLARGRGVRLQRYKDGGLSDIKTFKAAEGLTWRDKSGREHRRSMDDLADWRGERASAGRMAPQGMPRTNKFN
ncbi:DNA topoisomerase IV subunit A [Acuticoccus sediminis]|uniref:DNA topoisomerase 4 subunit A n=1 Tax=Acuticoccus sediminis TaxID=2184697 RepID=A0A8B2NKU5_9HYPH|nr:DNA topoisomerase IV subunit A [Acuticoccus sediminis]RAH98725.1 DNA topoisomerase IV subunit A [Acuticoccus sediminis]